MSNSSRRQWDGVRAQLSKSQPGAKVRVPRTAIPHPREAGARPTVSIPSGQVFDYAIEGTAGQAPLVVREHEQYFEAFIDGARSLSQMMRALQGIEAKPQTAMYAGGALLGGALGASLSNKREGVLIGVGLGLLFAALLNDAVEND